MSAVKKVTKKKVTKRASSKRASFNPIAICASNSNGKYRIEKKSIKPPNRPKTIEQMKANLKAEDIKYVFLYVLSLWSSGDRLVSANMKKYADKRQIRANGINDRFAGREIYRATHRDLLVQCQKLLTQLEAGRVVTLTSKAGKMNVNPEPIDGMADINDVNTLMWYLENWLLNNHPENHPEKKDKKKDNLCDSVRHMCIIGYMPQFRTFTLK